MRNLPTLVLSICITFFLSLNLFAQAPQTFHYQLLVKDGIGDIVHDQVVGVKVSILQSQTRVYEETYIPVEVQFGQLSIRVGTGTPSIGQFSNIDWSNGQYSIEAAIDLEGGTNYTLTQTQSLNSLPYALHTNAMSGVVSKSEAERDAIIDPAAGQIVFCKNCGEFGQFQIYNGTAWTNALGQPADGPILIESLRVIVKDISELNAPIEEGTLPLELDLTPSNASDKTATWTSSDETIATVDDNGLIQILSEGIVTISAVANDGGGAQGSIELNFETERPSTELPTGLHISGDIVFALDDRRQLMAILHPFEELDSLARWSSLNETRATVDENGIVHGIDTGRVRIVAESGTDTIFRDTLEIVIYDMNPDLTAPVITIEEYDGINEIRLQRGSTAKIPTATAEDDEDGTVGVNTQLDLGFNPSPFDSMTLTSYRVIYSSADSKGNSFTDSVIVSVVDTLSPVINLTGNIVFGDTLFSDNTKTVTLPTASALDDNGDVVTVSVIEGDFVNSKAGIFSIYYEATDPSGNKKIDSITIVNADRISPTITLSDGAVNGDTLIVPQGLAYDLPTATAVDDDGTVLTLLTDDGGFDTLEMGHYPIQYQAKDSSGNVTTVQVTAYVIDNVAPTIDNKPALLTVSAAFPLGTEEVVAELESSDNVGIVSYEIFDLTTIGIYRAENWNGTARINSQGEIVLGGGAFESDFYFRIIVTDAAGLKDSMDMRFIYSTGQIKDIRAKEYLKSDWTQLGEPFGNPNAYEYKLKEESKVADTVLFLTAGGNFFTAFKEIIWHPTNPGSGSTDFTLSNNGTEYYLILNNTLDNDVQATYELNFEVITQNRADTTVMSSLPLPITIDVESVRELSPALDANFPTSTYTQALTLGDLLNPVGDAVNDLACPLKLANTILGDLAEGLDQLITELPVIPDSTELVIAKRLMDKLPAYFWVAKDGQKTRMNIKVPVKGKSLRLEYVIDPENNGCYWGALVDKLKPSGINSRLSALDESTVAGAVVNTVKITEKDFKCITIPCLTLDPGAHIVAYGNPTKSVTGGGASAILEPTIFGVVTPLSAGFSDPELKLTMGLKADFRTEFSQEMVQRLDLASAATRTSITLARQGAAAAEKKLDEAAAQLGLKRRELEFLDRQIARVAYPVTRLTGRVADLNSQVLGTAAELAGLLAANEICTPGICLIPCLTPGTCSRNCGFVRCYYPCLRSCGCELRAPEICVPNPAAELLSSVFGARSWLRTLENRLANATAALDRAQRRLSQVSSPRQALQAAFDTAADAVDQATSDLNFANQHLADVIANAGPLADIADFILNNTINKTVATTKATFVTTLASANNGTYTGQLTVGIKILNLPEQTLTFPQFSLNGNDVESSLESAVDLIIDQID